MTGDRLLDFVNNTLFPTLKKLPVTASTPIRKAIVQTTFADANNYMKDGVLLRQVVNVIDGLDLADYEESHAFGEIYESILKELQSAGSAGEFYTPRAVTDFMAKMIEPKIGETMADFACGTGGFITSWLKELERAVKTTEDREAYGEKMPRTEAEWFGALRWQARSYLSHLRDRGDRHAKYIEEMSGLLDGVFADGHQGAGLDAGTRTRALARALDKLRRDQDISRRDLIIYIGLAARGISGKKLAARFDTNANNVYMIKFRVGNIICKYGPRYFEEALRSEGFDPGLDLAA